jgi:hypothetical protein
MIYYTATQADASFYSFVIAERIQAPRKAYPLFLGFIKLLESIIFF